ncbi:hydroxyisourate hydrolase [Acinetobacter haemolyticus]|nr:hydroxyisourate hydrolase [Acinetobacter haemolyticus]
MISSHILDTNLGKPAANVLIKLFNADGMLLGEGQTNADGRVTDFGLSEFSTGSYSLEGEFKHEVRQFQKPYDNQQAEQISLMV